MNVDEYEEKHLATLIAQKYEDDFGPTQVQRLCNIGYNAACHVLERGVRKGVIVNGSKPWNYRLAI